MSLIALFLACIALLNLSIGLNVYRRNPSASSHRAFALMALTLSLWTIALAIAHYSPTANTLALRTAFAAASLIPIGVLSFVEHTPHQFAIAGKLRQRLFTPVAIVLCGMSFSSLIVVSVRSDQGHSLTEYGPLHPIFALYVTVALLYAVLILWLRFRASTGSTRVQIGHLILAFCVPSSLAIVTNLAVPILFGTSALSKYGPFFTVPVLALIGHSIIRHRLLDVRVVVRHSAVYLAVLCTSGLVLVTLLSLSNVVFRDDHAIPVREVLLALGVALFFSPLKTVIQRAFDKYLYREPYSYQRIVRDVSQALRGTIDLTLLLEYVTGAIVRTLKPECIAIFLLDDDDDQFRLAGQPSGGHFPEAIPTTSPMLGSVLATKDMAFGDRSLMERNAAFDTSMASDLATMDRGLIVPLVEESDVIGLLCIGRKRSGDPYFSDDADLLATLANQSAVAIRNAQTHQRVVQLNEKLQAVLATIESGVVAVGARGEITLFNRAADRLTGMPADTARGHRVQELPAPLAECLTGTLADGQARSQVEFSMPDAAGQIIPLVCSTSPLWNPTGRPAGAVAVINDISHLKELEHEKRRAERLASIEAIAAGLVHEIRNPLVAVKTFSQLLPTRYQDPEFRETFSRTASREIRRIDNLLTRFRTLASASSEPMGSVDIGEPIRHALDLLRPQLEERQIRVRKVSDGSPRPVLGNASQLEQLFLNLCLNAIEAMGPGGELTLRVADLSDGGGTTLLAEVSDTGDGIPEELLAKIFDPFVSTKARGSGLGLAICRAIADAHRARLSGRNNAGRPGSTFMIEFPVPVATPSAAATT